jgi:hypothetical protein
MAFEIEVKGAAAVVEAMFRLDKELWRELQKDVRKAGQEAAMEAGQNMPSKPLSNWGKWIEFSGRGKSLWYEMPGAGKFTSSFRSKSTSGFRQVYSVVGPSKGNAAGAIFLLAGSVDRTASKHPQGAARSRRFKAALNSRHGGSPGARGNGTWPRVLGPLYYKHRDKIGKEIGQAVERATTRFNKG